MRVYGHRRNSVAGAVAAFDSGAHGVEVDVRRAPGGALVLSNAPLPPDVAGLTPLADVLDAARGRVICEVKNLPGDPDFDAPFEATARLLVAALGARGDADVVVSSFDWFAIELARDAGLRTAFLTPPGLALEAALAYVSEAGHAECHPHWSAVLDDPARVGAAHDAVAWSVADPEVVGRLRDAGVDGVIADDPARWLDDD